MYKCGTVLQLKTTKMCTGASHLYINRQFKSSNPQNYCRLINFCSSVCGVTNYFYQDMIDHLSYYLIKAGFELTT